ncbi:ABC transporter permease [Candidatus Bipolaricaulota bacterium]|nr:ABC transporter permease [Candidatus Bipolaricaulota bacterium]
MWKNIRLLFSKELLGAVRDRRTLILTVFFPLIFYPLILSVMGRFNEAERVRLETLTPAVLLVDQSEDATFQSELQQSNAFYWVREDSVESAVNALRDEQGNLVMAVSKESGGQGIGLSVTLYYDQSDQFAYAAVQQVRGFLESYLKRVVNDKLQALGMLEEVQSATPPLSVQTVDVATGESIGRMILSRLLPYFMVLAILTGAMGLGAEITAGEKERSTIATLLVSQLSRTEIVLGKFLTVLTASLVSSLLSAIGLLIGVRFFGGGLAPGGSSAVFSLDLTAFGWMLVVLVPLAVILAALVIIVGSYARSQKEASTFLLPIYMVIVLVGMVSMTGTVSFEGLRYLIPVANSLYALQAIILGEAGLQNLLYTLVANVLSGAILIAAAVQLFKREAVLFRS